MALVLAGLAACELPLEEPGKTSTISKVSSTTADGWRYDFYRNTAYPCSISGYRSGRATVAEVAAQLYASDEHFGGLGEGDARVWVGALYRQVLDREPDAAGLDHWSPQAARGDRIGVARAIVVDSLESRRRRVTVLYQALLDRSPDAGGLDHWAEALRQDGDLGVATDLAASHEYFERAQDRPL